MTDLLPYRQRLALIRSGLAEKTTGPKPKKAIAKFSDKKLAEIAEEKNKTGDTLQNWFDHFMEVSEAVCAECGMRADWLKDPAYAKIWKACQAHILPKKKEYGFASIATHRENHIILFPSWGGHLCGCHGFYDSNWYNATTMNIWPKVIEQFKILYPFISEKERKNIPEQLLREIKS